MHLSGQDICPCTDLSRNGFYRKACHQQITDKQNTFVEIPRLIKEQLTRKDITMSLGIGAPACLFD